MEHFGRPDISVEEKIGNYRNFFARCHRWTRNGAWLSIQACAYGWLRREDLSSSFVAKEIFPESEFVHLAEIAKASEGLFEIVQLRNDRHHYERTCREWLARLRANWQEAVAASSEGIASNWERYLAMCIRGWETGATTLLRMTFRRIDQPRL
jgi:cyclopropane-fatty-acyl-phospholipid synthase